MTEPNLLEEPLDFSLVLGGPLFQLFRKSHLAGDSLDLLYRRLFIITLIAWLPLFLLATLASSVGNIGRLSFVHDVEVHVRFLIALPILVAAELIVHARIRPVVSNVIERRIVLPQDLPRFHSAIESAIRLRNSIPVEVGIDCCLHYWPVVVARSDQARRLDLVCHAGRSLEPDTRWLLVRVRQHTRCTAPPPALVLQALHLVSLSLASLQNQSKSRSDSPRSLRWSRLPGQECLCLRPILFAQGALLAGVVASRVLYRGESLLSFTPQMARAKRKGLADYGLLAQRYVESFGQKWVFRDTTDSDELLGAADIQSLADLGNSYALVREMHSVPFGLENISRLAATTAAPLLPLLLTIFSPEELIVRVIKIVF
jgi:hypothetical protein